MAIASHVGVGWRVESQTGTSATLASGSKPNHLLHAVLTVFTCGVWGFVWLLIAMTTKESRLTLTVDSYGHVQTTQPN